MWGVGGRNSQRKGPSLFTRKKSPARAGLLRIGSIKAAATAVAASFVAG